MTVERNRQREVMEDDLIVDLENECDSVREATQFGLIGKIISNRVLNRRGVMNVLHLIWPSRVLLKIFDLGPNLFGFSFADQKSMEFALNNGPWTVMGHHLCLRKWDIALAVGEVKFKEISFWTQVHNLPLELMSLNNARRIGVSLGNIIEIEDPNWITGYGRSFLRIKIAVNLRKPLIGKFKVPRGDGHSEKNCPSAGDSLLLESRRGKYGAWISTKSHDGGQYEGSNSVIHQFGMNMERGEGFGGIQEDILVEKGVHTVTVSSTSSLLSNTSDSYIVELPPEEDVQSEGLTNPVGARVCQEIVSQQLVPVLSNPSLKRPHKVLGEEESIHYRQKARQVELYEIAQKVFEEGEEEICEVEEVQSSISIGRSSNMHQGSVSAAKVQKQRRVVRRRRKRM
ncbi:hypothetical protein CCACVL1_12494 [Corchorus capsularis]|uniref:DUF4283 domain-containing protein n=1 Tax=Corchorus capsularis TaxID=210143 RepID=A0A1R3IF87_COCAP|nr:hypothetical protein CCACVL1_12494 [Corchorus capsularis]